jgi:hypothetical protein
MTFDDITIFHHKRVDTGRFGYWVFIRVKSSKTGQAARKSLLSFFEQSLGPLSGRWQYQKHNTADYIIKLDDERDLLLLLLKRK